MASKGKSRPKPYKQSTRRSSRVSASHVSEDTHSNPPVTTDDHSVVNSANAVDTANDQAHGSQGPSWTDFNNLKKSVSEMHDLLKSLSQNTSSSQSVVNNNASSSVDKANDELAQGISVDNHIFVSHDKPMEADNNPTVNFGDATTVNNSHANLNRNSEMVDIRDQVTRSSVNGFLDSFINAAASSGEIRYKEPGRPIDLKVTEKQRQKIWNNQFLELASLLDPQIHSEVELTIVSEPGEPLHFAPSKNLKTINNLGQWCSAFEIFICVYCQKFPTHVTALLTYMNNVKTLAHRNGDYLTYDREFRMMKESMYLPWELVHTGLWLECRDSGKNTKNSNSKPKNSGNSDSFRGKQSSGKQTRHPFGYCFRYHSFGKCGRSSCSYKHACYQCNDEKHSITRCPKATKNNSAPINEQSSK